MTAFYAIAICILAHAASTDAGLVACKDLKADPSWCVLQFTKANCEGNPFADTLIKTCPHLCGACSEIAVVSPPTAPPTPTPTPTPAPAAPPVAPLRLELEAAETLGDVCPMETKKKTCLGNPGCEWNKSQRRCSKVVEGLKVPVDLAVCETVKSKKVCRLNTDCKWQRDNATGKKVCNTVPAQSATTPLACTANTKKWKCRQDPSCAWKKGKCNDVPTLSLIV
jgi:hypothetical protein